MMTKCFVFNVCQIVPSISHLDSVSVENANMEVLLQYLGLTVNMDL